RAATGVGHGSADPGQVLLRGWRAHAVHRSRRLPLAGVFLLAPGGSTATAVVRTVAPGELLPALLANRHTAAVLDRAGHRRDVACLGALVRFVPGRELTRPDDLGTVPDAAAAVLTEAEKWRF